MMTFIHIFGLLGLFSMGVALVVLGRLSERLGSVTHARKSHRWQYFAACLIWAGMLTRLYFITQGQEALLAPNQNVLYTLVSDGLPAVGVTIGLIVTWHYWSWLLAERD